MLNKSEKKKVESALKRLYRYITPSSSIYLRKKGDVYALKVSNPYLGERGASTRNPCVFYELVSKLTKRFARSKPRLYDKDRVFYEAWEKCLKEKGFWLD